jgi:hypothetical protein
MKKNTYGKSYQAAYYNEAYLCRLNITRLSSARGPLPHLACLGMSQLFKALDKQLG